uniref:Intimal thickness related receptor IRP domain-containing protein n=1 Tax=viral metagenome TaxID=1070528 RepID=A0A6H1ZJD1_9ZZZZ
MVKPLLILLTLLILIIPLTNAAVDVEYIFKVNELAEIKTACFDTDYTLCTNSTACYITIHDPDGENIVNKQAMTFGAAYYSYNVTGTLLTKKGEYSTTVNCEGAYNGYSNFLFGVSSSGERTGGSGSAGIGILALLIIINVGVFAIAKANLSKNQILSYVLRGGCVLMGLYLLSLNMTIAVTLADNFTLGINQELFRFLWLINWTIYITMFIVVFRYFLGTLQLWTAKKTLRRMGLDRLE